MSHRIIATNCDEKYLSRRDDRRHSPRCNDARETNSSHRDNREEKYSPHFTFKGETSLPYTKEYVSEGYLSQAYNACQDYLPQKRHWSHFENNKKSDLSHQSKPSSVTKVCLILKYLTFDQFI